MTSLHESTGIYALNALDGAELVEFESHLASCPACQEEVYELCDTAAELSLLSLATPRPRLRDNVLSVTRTTPQTVLPEDSEPHVDELALRRGRRRARVLSGLVAAMLALAVGLGGVVYSLVQDRQVQVAQTALEEQLYSAPDATTTTTALPGGGQITLVASKQLNRALFLGTDLPDPNQNRYQLWTVTGKNLENRTGVERDVQVADTEPDVKAFFSGNIAGADFLAVNLEPAGSAPVLPTQSLLAVGPTTG